MKLKAKIYPKYLKQILNGKKKEDIRQLETITLVNSETGEEYEFEVDNVGICTVGWARDKYPDIKWGNKPMIVIDIGKKVR